MQHIRCVLLCPITVKTDSLTKINISPHLRNVGSRVMINRISKTSNWSVRSSDQEKNIDNFMLKTSRDGVFLTWKSVTFLVWLTADWKNTNFSFLMSSISYGRPVMCQSSLGFARVKDQVSKPSRIRLITWTATYIPAIYWPSCVVVLVLACTDCWAATAYQSKQLIEYSLQSVCLVS